MADEALEIEVKVTGDAAAIDLAREVARLAPLVLHDLRGGEERPQLHYDLAEKAEELALMLIEAFLDHGTGPSPGKSFSYEVEEQPKDSPPAPEPVADSPPAGAGDT